MSLPARKYQHNTHAHSIRLQQTHGHQRERWRTLDVDARKSEIPYVRCDFYHGHTRTHSHHRQATTFLLWTVYKRWRLIDSRKLLAFTPHLIIITLCVITQLSASTHSLIISVLDDISLSHQISGPKLDNVSVCSMCNNQSAILVQ